MTEQNLPKAVEGTPQLAKTPVGWGWVKGNATIIIVVLTGLVNLIVTLVGVTWFLSSQINDLRIEAIERDSKLQQETNDRISNLELKINENFRIQAEMFNQQFTEIKIELGKLNVKVDNLDVRIANLEDRMTNLEARVTNIQVDVAKIEARVANIQVDVAKIEARVTSIEADVAKIEARVTSIEADVAAIKIDLETLGEKATDIEVRVADIEVDVADIKDTIAPIFENTNTSAIYFTPW